MLVWTTYLAYRARTRGFDLVKLEEIVKYSTERYYDSATGRMVVVGWHDSDLVIIPYDTEDEVVTPVTVHATSRQQINFRLKNGRFK
jgi:hypothetical protein